ncbi:MAG: hypothetical protein P1V36_18160 [Planctomycetota bacterium]|nr:hypothetical protein [Planctomycetota bacterium]
MVVLTPDGRLLHAVTGYVRAKELQWELEQALESWDAVKKAAETAELQVQRRALATRQEAIQTAWQAEFGPKRKKGQAAPVRTWQSRQSEHDREILRENPMVHAGTITTRMLTGGPGTHFGYGKSDETGERTPATNEIRKRLGAPLVRETEADKRVRKRREKAAARNKVPARAAPARPAPARPAAGRAPLR